MLRKKLFILLGALLLTLVFSAPALAETYTFGDIRPNFLFSFFLDLN